MYLYLYLYLYSYLYVYVYRSMRTMNTASSGVISHLLSTRWEMKRVSPSQCVCSDGGYGPIAASYAHSQVHFTQKKDVGPSPVLSARS